MKVAAWFKLELQKTLLIPPPIWRWTWRSASHVVCDTWGRKRHGHRQIRRGGLGEALSVTQKRIVL